jgi:protein SCO1/2
MRPSLVFTFLLVCAGVTARADSSTPIDIARDVRFDQNLGVQVPLDLPFISDTGAPVHLGDYFHKRPVLLILDYYRCPNLCGIVLNSFVTSLKGLTYNAGDRYEVVVVSIDPRDTPAISGLKKLGYVDTYQRPQTADGWHFLTGSPDSIKKLADTVGFHYVYDPASDQYAHPSGMIVLTPGGVTSRYFFAASKVHSPVYDFLLLCCRYNPLQGKYGILIFNLMRASGCLMVLLVAGYVIHSLRTELAEKSETGSSPK